MTYTCKIRMTHGEEVFDVTVEANVEASQSKDGKELTVAAILVAVEREGVKTRAEDLPEAVQKMLSNMICDRVAEEYQAGPMQ